MKSKERYIWFSKKFHEYKIPKLKFKELDTRDKYLYKNIYEIDEEDINKASFIIFFTSFLLIGITSLIFTKLNIFIIILYSMIASLLISYRFNLILYNNIKKLEKNINAYLYIIKIDFSLMYKSLSTNSDYSMNFIKLIMNYNLPLSNDFKKIFRKIHEGKNPEMELLNIVSPSKDFDTYLQGLILSNFNQTPEVNNVELNTAEKNFKIYLKEIKSKISIIFFIGMFCPIGLCFLILFQQLNTIITILFIPIFLLFLNFLFKKFILNDTFLIGLIKIYSSEDKRRFNEFLLLLKGFAFNLKKQYSPEKAFYRAFLENKHDLNLLKNQIHKQISSLLNLSFTFNEMIDACKSEFVDRNYNLLLDVIKNLVKEDAYHTSEKIFEILKNIKKHQKLESKLEIIIKGEKFKVLMFLFLLPLVLGAIGGLLPLFTAISTPFNSNNNLLNDLSFSFNKIPLIAFIEIILIFLIFLSSNTISAFNFLRIIDYDSKFLMIFISNSFYVLIFFITLTNFLFFI
jgi:hypothetical protein